MTMKDQTLHKPRIIGSLACALTLALSFGCGGKSSPGDPDAAVPDARIPPDAAPFMSCGDSLVSGSEECDDGNLSEDDECLNDCTLACGDGVVNSVETCDTGVPAGMPGACPTACDDNDACTTEVLTGTTCTTECLVTPVTAPIDGDGCCPPGQDATTDSDCTAVCGNSIIEAGETCDTGIPAGMPGACPDAADCVDGAVCTTDALDYAGTCQATCRFDPITSPADGDGCCPAGADAGNDNDCAPGCGDGVYSPASGETCDIAIPAGMPGACPQAADCVDGDACTEDVLTGDGTCMALCTNPAITTPDDTNSDGCCPVGTGNANNDLDCTPVCGNGALETGEACDDGNVANGDGCNDACALEPTAFRITNLQLRDPHAFTLIFLIACTDITSNLNTELNNAITGDADGDGLLDFSVVNLFRPLDQAAMSTPMEIVFGDCTSPAGSTSCSQPANNPPIVSTATNMNTGTCLAPTGNVGAYNPPVANATAPCYVSDPESLTVDLSGILVPLTDARIGATYMGNPATSMVNGLLEGFISEADAEATIIPANIPVVGGQSLASILPGGMGNCSTNDDRDTGPDGVTTGWWLHFNFTATQVPWTSP